MKNLLFEVSATDPAIFALIDFTAAAGRPDGQLYSGAESDESRPIGSIAARVGLTAHYTHILVNS